MANQDNLPQCQKSHNSLTNKIPVELAIEYANKGLHPTDIAQLLNCSKRHVYRILEPYRDKVLSYQKFKDNQSDYYLWKAKEYVDSVTDENINSMTGLQKVTAAGILIDKAHTSKGISIGNSAPVNIQINFVDNKDNDK